MWVLALSGPCLFSTEAAERQRPEIPHLLNNDYAGRGKETSKALCCCLSWKCSCHPGLGTYVLWRPGQLQNRAHGMGLPTLLVGEIDEVTVSKGRGMHTGYCLTSGTNHNSPDSLVLPPDPRFLWKVRGLMEMMSEGFLKSNNSYSHLGQKTRGCGSQEEP